MSGLCCPSCYSARILVRNGLGTCSTCGAECTEADARETLCRVTAPSDLLMDLPYAEHVGDYRHEIKTPLPALPSQQADVAKCHGTRCRVRWSCDRYVRPAAVRQTWLIVPEHEQGAECRHRVEAREENHG